MSDYVDLNETDVIPEFNQWTRNHDDKCSYDLQRGISQKPMKYVTYTADYMKEECDVNIPGSLCGGTTYVGSESVVVENELRSEMTNNNDINQLEPQMFLSQPYMGSGDLLGENNLVNVSSDLRGNHTKVDSSCFRPDVIFHTPHILLDNPQTGAVHPQGWVPGGRSSRMDMRELHNQVCKN
tara:strand:- start:1929 stop:2474 length:546 start_codon:yes stop_codon:yes gene_type:complete